MTRCWPPTHCDNKKPSKPLPIPAETRTRIDGYRFGPGRVRVVTWYPRVTRDNHYYRTRSSLTEALNLHRRHSSNFWNYLELNSHCQRLTIPKPMALQNKQTKKSKLIYRSTAHLIQKTGSRHFTPWNSLTTTNDTQTGKTHPSNSCSENHRWQYPCLSKTRNTHLWRIKWKPYYGIEKKR